MRFFFCCALLAAQRNTAIIYQAYLFVGPQALDSARRYLLAQPPRFSSIRYACYFTAIIFLLLVIFFGAAASTMLPSYAAGRATVAAAPA